MINFKAGVFFIRISSLTYNFIILHNYNAGPDDNAEKNSRQNSVCRDIIKDKACFQNYKSPKCI